MAMTKKYDAAVKTGTYESNGQTKNRYENVGIVMENDKGELSLLLKATFNPAGVPRDAGRESIFVSFFTPKGDNNQPTAHDTAKQNAYQPEAQKLDDEVPF